MPSSCGSSDTTLDAQAAFEIVKEATEKVFSYDGASNIFNGVAPTSTAPLREVGLDSLDAVQVIAKAESMLWEKNGSPGERPKVIQPVPDVRSLVDSLVALDSAYKNEAMQAPSTDMNVADTQSEQGKVRRGSK